MIFRIGNQSDEVDESFFVLCLKFATKILCGRYICMGKIWNSVKGKHTSVDDGELAF